MEEKERKHIGLQYDGDEMVAVFPRKPVGGLDAFRRLVRFYDRVLELAELPEREELPKILKVASKHSLPSIWRRVRHSKLETMAALLITTLAFSPRKNWGRTVREYLVQHRLEIKLRGRPLKNVEDLDDLARGRAIDRLIPGLQKGFQIKVEAKRKGGGTIEDEETASKLKEEGLEPEAIDAILKEQRLEGAGCRFYRETQENSVQLRSIKNSYARYKSMKRQLKLTSG